jgi:Ca2+-binding EF-hand superfamily protein
LVWRVGTLSLTELALGLSLIAEGTDEERIIAAFNAYDIDKSGALDYNEIVQLVSVVKGVTQEVAK